MNDKPIDVEVEEKAELEPVKESTMIGWTASEEALIRRTYANNASDDEFHLFMYTAKTWGLDPLKKEIWCVKFQGQPAQIYASRDGHIKVAHDTRTKDGDIALDGFESDIIEDENGKLKGAFCIIHRKDMSHPVKVTVDFEEYNTNQALWKSKPKTMIKKVAESQCLRKAFSMHGFYSPEEMDQWEITAGKTGGQTSGQKKQYKGKFPTNREYWDDYDWTKVDINKVPPSPGYDKAKNKPKSALEPLKLYFYSKDVLPEAEASSFITSIVNKKTYEMTYGEIQKVVTALMELDDDIKNEGEEMQNVTDEQLEMG